MAFWNSEGWKTQSEYVFHTFYIDKRDAGKRIQNKLNVKCNKNKRINPIQLYCLDIDLKVTIRVKSS